MEILPTGNTSLNELTQKYVRKQYGEEAVSELEANITTVEKEAAGQAIDGAIMADKLHPYVKPPDGIEQRLTKDGWDLPLPGENYDDNVWRTFATGELNHGQNDDLRDLTVYFRNEEASNFLKPISSDTSTQPEPGPPIKPPVNDSVRGQPKFPHEDEVKRAIIKACKKKPKPTRGQMPYMENVISAFAPGKEMHITPGMDKEKYKELTGWKPSTIMKLVRKYYK